MDSWIYPALARLHALGYLDTAFLGVRPWTRRSIMRMLDDVDQQEQVETGSQAAEIVASVRREVGSEDDEQPGGARQDFSYGCEQMYTRLQGIGGLALRDSFHLGQTIANDYGRPYQPGFNTVDGAAGSAEFGRFSLFARGEYQHAPSAAGYSPGLVAQLAAIDAASTPYPLPGNLAALITPAGPVMQTNTFRLLEVNLSYRILNHEISFGKSDHWLAPTVGGAFMYSNNAENIYAFQIDRTEPLFIPFLSRLVGPFRYDFFVGSLKGHSAPRDPWLHVEKLNFNPTPNVEFGFERSVIWGGKGRGCQLTPPPNATYAPCDEPITLHSFLKSFFSTANTTDAVKFSRNDPGARFASFDFSWRLPWLNHWMTLYTDSMVHDDISPIDAPRHAAVRPGLYLARIPGTERFDARFEGALTNVDAGRSGLGQYMYFERVQPQGYTNKGNLMGDAIGREGQGGQAWLTYHLSPMEMVQTSFKHNKVADDFIPGGTTQNSFDVHVVKRVGEALEISADVQHEWWKAPIYKTGQQSDTVATFQFTLYPERKGKTAVSAGASPVY
ncbi:MAG TPA: capsule assembly Wzi family protein [Acidobacteriaceae bacterium]|nr:capsule assembly Wzi family protein [Acidobacteriaceae bacterium]